MTEPWHLASLRVDAFVLSCPYRNIPRAATPAIGDNRKAIGFTFARPRISRWISHSITLHATDRPV